MAVITGDGTLQGTDAEDQITGGAGNDTLLGGAGNDVLEGGSGFDFAVYWTSGSAIGVQLFRGIVDDGFGGTDRLSNIEGVIGSAWDDIILGSGLTDVLLGLDGDDTIQGLGGDDALNGNSGDDEITGGEGSDTVYGEGNRADYTVTAVAGGFTVADNRAGAGNEGTDTVTEVEFFSFADGVFSAAELLNPLAGQPTTGDDSINRGPGDDFVDALAGDDTVNGGGGDDTLAGGEGNDLLLGGDGTDTANFSGNRADYTVTGAQGGGLSIVDNRGIDGADTLRGVEFAAFADGVAPTAALLPSVGVAADLSSRVEGNGGATAFTFTARLSAAAGTAQSVEWRVAGVGAAPADASDFAGGAAPSGTVIFAAGETSKTITVNVVGDAAVEANEAFALVLSNASPGLALGATSATATILNDDAAPTPPNLPVVRGTAGDDALAWRPGQHAYEGLGGRDTLDLGGLGFRRADAAAQADGSVVVTHGDQAAVLRGVEEVRFADGRLVFDAADPAAQVARLYEAALDRLPDQGGLNFWIDAVQDGQSLSGLASGFLASGEFQARFGGAGTGNGAFVDQLYQNVLGRAGEAGGRDFWVGTLNAGTGRADVLVAFSESAENKAGTAALVQGGIWDRSEAAAQVARLYDTVLGRAPDTGGLSFWKNALEGGTATLGQMADSFAGSAEFRAKYGSLGNRDFADALYVNTLDRPADRSGLDHWTGVLDRGTSRAEVVLAFSESAEHVNLTAGGIQSENPAEFGILFA